MIFQGRGISNGKARGEVIKIDEPLSFLGGVDGTTGDLRVRDGNVAGKVLVFPKGKGSTVGSYVMYDLMVHGREPAAIVNETAETIVATGAVISSIPMIDRIPSVRLFEDGDIVTVDAAAGTVDIEGVVYKEVVSSVVSKGDRCILERRPERCRSFPGHWSLVAGKVEAGETPVEAARREILEETSGTRSVPWNRCMCAREGHCSRFTRSTSMPADRRSSSTRRTMNTSGRPSRMRRG